MRQLLPYIAPQQLLDVRDFGAACDGSTNDTASVQSAFDTAAAAGGGLVQFPVGACQVTTVELPSTVTMRGMGADPNTGGATTIVGTPGSPVVTLPASGPQIGFGIEQLGISGGLNGLYAPSTASYHTYLHLRDVSIFSATTACINIESRIEEWTLDNVTLYGGQYGVRYNGARMDKCTFKDIECRGQSLNGWNILTSEFSGTCIWIRPILHTAAQHAFVAAVTGGATIRGWVFIGAYGEGTGQTGKKARTTGTITTGTASLVVASTTGFAEGDPIVVAGAGTNGVDLFTTLNTIAGTTFTLAANAATSVTSGKVTNASYDDFSFPSGAGDLTFIGGQLASEGTGGNVRYAIDARGVTTNLLGRGVGQASALPVYDPARVANGFDSIRQPDNYTNHNMIHWMMPGPRSGVEMTRSLVVSPPGKNFVVGLRDSNDNTTGTFGQMEVRTNDASKTVRFSVDGSGNTTMKGALDHDGSTVGFYGTAPGAKPAITGAKAGNAALADLLTKLAALGLVTDSTT